MSVAIEPKIVVIEDEPQMLRFLVALTRSHGFEVFGTARAADGIAAIKRAYRALYRSGLSLDEARIRIGEIAADQPEVDAFASFIRGRRSTRPSPASMCSSAAPTWPKATPMR